MKYRRGKWQGRLDSNQRMAGSKPAALPLGDAPVVLLECRFGIPFSDQSFQLPVQHRDVASFGDEPLKVVWKKGRDFISFSFVWKLPNTQPPVPVNLAETNLFSKIKALRTSG